MLILGKNIIYIYSYIICRAQVCLFQTLSGAGNKPEHGANDFHLSLTRRWRSFALHPRPRTPLSQLHPIISQYLGLILGGFTRRELVI
jgi:hypothetical protein